MTNEETLKILEEDFVFALGSEDPNDPTNNNAEVSYSGGEPMPLKGKTYEIIIKNGHVWMSNCTVSVTFLPAKWPIFEEVKIFDCEDHGIQTLEHVSKICKTELKVRRNTLTSLKGPKSVPHILMSYHETLPLLDLFHIADLRKVTFDGHINLASGDDHDGNKKLEGLSKIIEKYLPLGIRGIAPCMFALRSEGFDGNARTTY